MQVKPELKNKLPWEIVSLIDAFEYVKTWEPECWFKDKDGNMYSIRREEEKKLYSPEDELKVVEDPSL